MKKFFIAVCLTAMVSLNVVAQEVPVIEAPAIDSDVVLVSQDEAAPAAEAVVSEVTAPVEGTVTAAPVETYAPAAYAAPVAQEVMMGAGAGCGQVAAPVYNSAPMYNAPVATGCSSCGQAAAPAYAAPVSTGCSSCGDVAAPVYNAAPVTMRLQLQLQSIAQLQSLLDAALVQRLLLLPPLLVVTTVVTVAKSSAVFADQSARVLAKSAADATTAVTNLIVS
jgi:hypothetical protein